MNDLHLLMNRDPAFPDTYDKLGLLPGSTHTLFWGIEVVGGYRHDAILSISPEDLRTITDWLTARVAELDKLGALPPRKERKHEEPSLDHKP